MARYSSPGRAARHRTEPLVLAFLAFALGVPANALGGVASPEWLGLRGTLLAAMQETGGQAFSPMVSWNPRFPLATHTALFGDAGVTEFVNSQGAMFSAFNYGAGVSRELSSKIALEGEIGAQYWAGDGGNVNAPMVGADVAYSPDVAPTVFAGFSVVFVPKLTTWMARIGVGI